jgi:hypothetical protein
MNIQKNYPLEKIPEFRRLQKANPRKNLDAHAAATMYVKAIHWASILNILAPNFNDSDFHSIKLAYIVINDPDEPIIEDDFYDFLSNTITSYWSAHLKNLFPNGNWEIDIRNDHDKTIAVTIHSR